MVAAFGLLATPTISFAADPPGPVAPLAVQGDPHAVTITPVQWTLVTGLILPFVLAVFVKAGRSAKFKGVAAIVTAAIAAIVERATLADGSGVFTSGQLLDGLYVYGPALLTYLGLWSHFKINERILPTFGI
jgi:hypothetical protein